MPLYFSAVLSWRLLLSLDHFTVPFPQTCVLLSAPARLFELYAPRRHERQRIQAAGGTIIDGRTAGVLEPSRTIGDADVRARAGVDDAGDQAGY